MEPLFTAHGQLFGAQIASLQSGREYDVLVEATPQMVSLFRALALPDASVAVGGRGYLRVPYSEELDQLILEAVDVLADLRYHRPGFGQMILFEEERDHAAPA